LYPHNLRRQALYFDQQTYYVPFYTEMTGHNGASIAANFLDQRLIIGLGSLDDKWMFTGKKFILKTAMEDRLPKEILKFKSWTKCSMGDYLTKVPFKDELESFQK
jgi:asparagine synthase (glutamine-hydrolysing)